jgi:16S rRNA (cytosine967-C5)-methyltransferase
MAEGVREGAVSILTRVEQSREHAEDLLNLYLGVKEELEERDRRLLTELTYGTLRMRGVCDGILKSYLHNWRALSPVVKNILRLAVYQIIYTHRIPPFAIVHEAVEQAKRVSPGHAKLVNAILRKILLKKREELLPESELTTPQSIARVYSHPLWLVSRWLKEWGIEETIKLCEANNDIPPRTLRVNTLKSSREEAKDTLSREGISVKETSYSPDGLFVLDRGFRWGASKAFREGWVVYQDEASQLISYLVSPLPGEEILDLCAGRGGKTFHLAALMKNEGKILSVDVEEDKLVKLMNSAALFGASIIEVKRYDATEVPPYEFKERFHRVLIDAPCSGTGTLRRAPEIKWRLRPGDVEKMAQKQKRILDFAALCVRKGGRVVYCTCSIMAEENERVVEAFLREREDFESVSPSGMLSHLIDGRGFFHTFPHRHGMDGFFAAVMVKK